MHFYEHYQKGFYQEVYEDLLAMQEQAFHEPPYQDALLVARIMMQRVRYNTETLIARLANLNYQFVGRSLAEISSSKTPFNDPIQVYKTTPIFQAPETEMPQRISDLEQHVGSFPLSLKCWYEEVGSVNLIGVLPTTEKHTEFRSILDPLFVFSPDFLTEYFSANPLQGQGKVKIPLAPDGALKYGYGGSGP